jgi:ribosomal protein S6--L-glutamate ligase
VHVAILSARSGWHTDELRRALADRGHTCVVAPYEALIARIGSGSGDGVQLLGGDAQWQEPPSDSGNRESLPGDARWDAVLARIIPNGSLEQIIFRVDALHWLEDRGIRVINPPRAIERTVDKFYTSALLRDARLPTPETIVCEDFKTAMAAVREMGDVVVKPIFGSMGHGLVRISDPEIGFRILRPLEQAGAVFYVQRVIGHDGRDIRAFVVGGRVVGAIERRAPDGDWRTNVSRGGTAHAIDLCGQYRQYAIEATLAVGADYAGVDLLPGQDGRVYVLEVNGIPGWRGLQQATGIDVAGAVTDLLTAEARS